MSDETRPTAPVRTRRWPRRVLYVLGGLLLLLLLLLGGLFTYVNTSGGERRVRDFALEAANGAIQGKLGWDSLDVRGDHFIFRGLKLYDPEGVLVAEIDTVELRVAFRALVRRRFIVEQARIFRPRLYLVQDERGLNLARAIASRNPSEEEEKPAERRPGEVFFKLDELRLEEGYVDFEQHGEERDLHARIEDLGATGDAMFQSAGRKLQANLTMNGRTSAPVQGPLAIVSRVGVDGEQGGGGLRIELPGVVLDVNGDFQQNGERAHANLKQVDLHPETARAFLPSYPLKVPVALTGTAERNGNLTKADLTADAAEGKLHLKGDFDVAQLSSPGFTLRAEGINLAGLIDDAPPSDLSLTLEGKGGGTSLETAEGEVKLDVPPSKLRSETVGPVRLVARASKGQFEVPDLVAVLPGVQLNATASGNLDTVKAQGRLEARDLSRLTRALGKLGEKELPELAGSGSLGFRVQGPTKHPGVKLEGTFPTLRYGTTSLRELQLNADVPDVSQPLDSEGALTVAYLKAGERVFRALGVHLTSHGKALDLDVVTGGAIDLHLAAEGTRDDDSRGLLLSTFRLAYSDLEWTLQRPAKLTFRDERLAAEPIELRAGDQRLVLGGSKAGDRVTADVTLERFDLSRLPKAFVDPSYQLAGRVDGEVHARGRMASPEVAAKVRLDGGQFRDYRNLGFAVDATYAKDRADGTLTASSDVADLRAEFSVPVVGLQRRRNEPVRLVLDVAETPIADTLKALGRPEQGNGTLKAQLIVTGTARDPLATVSVRGRDVRVGDYPPPSLERLDFDVRMESALEDRLEARLDVGAIGMSGLLALRTPLTLGQVLAKPPTAKSLQKVPMELDVSLQGLPLALASATDSTGQGRKLTGTASLRAEARGTLEAPTVNAELRLLGAGLEGAQPTDGTVTLVATGERIDAFVEAHRNDRRLLELTAKVAAPIATLLDARALPDVAVAIDGTLHPTALSELVPPRPPTEEDDEETASTPAAAGIVLARLTAAGTLRDPRIRFRGNVEELRVSEACIGRAAIAFDYANARSVLDADVTSTGEGRLRVNGTLGLDLGYASLKEGLKVDDAPLTASVVATKFELASFTGLIPKVRAISGLLEADIAARGTVGAPKVQGDAEWKNGKVALEGYGDYREAHLLLHATNDLVEVRDLSMKSGAGSFKLDAAARKRGPVYVLTGKASSEKFPVVVDDQLMAVLTTRLTLDGELSSAEVNIRNLTIPEAHVELPEIGGGKDLQELDRPEDIVLVRNGKPLKKRKTPAPAPATPPGEAAPGSAAPGSGGGGGVGTGAVAATPAAPSEEPGRKYEIHVNAPRNLWVRSVVDDVNMELGLPNGLQIEYREALSMVGEVRVLRGTLVALGRKFVVQRDSSVNFTGPPKLPYLNVTAEHVNEREEVTVFATIRGQGKEVSLKVSSQPALPETEIYTLLATGRRTLKRGSGASMNTGDAASIVGALAATQLKRGLANKLPLDVLSIESTGSGLAGTRIEAGTYLTDKWYMGYTGQLGAEDTDRENTYGVRVEYQWTPNVSIEGEYGDQRKGADLIWSREY